MMPAELSPGGRRLAWGIIAAASLIMLLLITDGRPWTLFASGAFSSNFYDAQADALTRGDLAVDPSVASIEGIGQGEHGTHLYYGILLALLRVPLALVTDSLFGQLTRVSILVAYTLALVLSVHLAHAARLVVGREPDERDQWRVALLLLAVAASPALYAFGWISVYHETELWAFTLALAALVCAVRLITMPRRSWAYGAAIASSLCTMTRASVGVGVTVATLIALVVAYRPSVGRMIGPALATVAGGVVHGIVNTARFGGPWEIPVVDQVQTSIEPARARWFAEHGNSFFGLEFVPSNLLQYLRPDAVRFERVVPFVRFSPPATELNGVDFESITPAASLTVAATLLLVLAGGGVVWAIRERRLALLAMIVGTAMAAVPTLALGFVANRYLIDFLPMLALAAAVAVWLEAPTWLPVRVLTIALVTWGVVVNATLGVWSGQAANPGFVEGRFRLDERLFDPPSPGLIQLADATDGTPFGTFAIDADANRCHGVYVVGDEGWTAVERSPGDRRVAGTVPMGDVRLVDNPAWTLDLRADGVVLFGADGQEHVLATIDAPDGATIDFTVVSDPITGERFGDIDGTVFFLPQSVLDSGPMGAASDEAAPLCRLLTDRLGEDALG
jgi:hypothetical protein